LSAKVDLRLGAADKEGKMRVRILIPFLMIVMALAAGELTAQVTDNSASTHVFAQFADGTFSDGTFYRATVMVSSDNVNSINCTAILYGLTVQGFGDGSVRTFTLAAGGWSIYKTPGTQSFRNGYMTLNCNAAVTAQVLYTFHSASGLVLSEATVFSSPAASIAQLLTDQRNGAQLGIAVANNGGVSKEFVIVALDSAGNEAGRRSIQIPGRSQIARFLNELISLPPDYVGQVQISTNTTDTLDVYAIGLRFTGSAFTTTPVTLRTPR
jgi:hypothetical protein